MCGQKKENNNNNNYYRANLLIPTSVNAATQVQTVELVAVNFKLKVI